MPHKDPEVRKEYHRKYFQRNREKLLAMSSQWKKDNPEAETRHKREYRKRNMAKFNEYAATRRARLLDQTPYLSVAEQAEIDGMYEYHQIMPGNWHVDHKVAISNGGLHHPHNLQLLSEHDNCTKWAK